MPSRQTNNFLQMIGVLGQTISGIAQIRDAQAKAETEAKEKAKKQKRADVLFKQKQTELQEANFLKLHPETGMMSIPFPEGEGGMDFRPTPEKPLPSASEMLTQRRAQANLGILPQLAADVKAPTQTPLWMFTAKATIAQAEGTSTQFQDVVLSQQDEKSKSEADEVVINGVPFKTIRQVLTDSFPVKRGAFGETAGERTNLPADVNTALIQGDPIPMYEFIANFWKEKQREQANEKKLAKALSKKRKKK